MALHAVRGAHGSRRRVGGPVSLHAKAQCPQRGLRMEVVVVCMAQCPFTPRPSVPSVARTEVHVVRMAQCPFTPRVDRTEVVVVRKAQCPSTPRPSVPSVVCTEVIVVRMAQCPFTPRVERTEVVIVRMAQCPFTPRVAHGSRCRVVMQLMQVANRPSRHVWSNHAPMQMDHFGT